MNAEASLHISNVNGMKRGQPSNRESVFGQMIPGTKTARRAQLCGVEQSVDKIPASFPGKPGSIIPSEGGAIGQVSNLTPRVATPVYDPHSRADNSRANFIPRGVHANRDEIVVDGVIVVQQHKIFAARLAEAVVVIPIGADIHSMTNMTKPPVGDPF
jgi:hypothetical protein